MAPARAEHEAALGGILVLLPDGSVRIYEEQSSLTAADVLSEFPDYELGCMAGSSRAMVSADPRPLIPGRSYYLSQRAYRSAVFIRGTPLGEDGPEERLRLYQQQQQPQMGQGQYHEDQQQQQQQQQLLLQRLDQKQRLQLQIQQIQELATKQKQERRLQQQQQQHQEQQQVVPPPLVPGDCFATSRRRSVIQSDDVGGPAFGGATDSPAATARTPRTPSSPSTVSPSHSPSSSIISSSSSSSGRWTAASSSSGSSSTSSAGAGAGIPPRSPTGVPASAQLPHIYVSSGAGGGLPPMAASANRRKSLASPPAAMSASCGWTDVAPLPRSRPFERDVAGRVAAAELASSAAELAASDAAAASGKQNPILAELCLWEEGEEEDTDTQCTSSLGEDGKIHSSSSSSSVSGKAKKFLSRRGSKSSPSLTSSLLRLDFVHLKARPFLSKIGLSPDSKGQSDSWPSHSLSQEQASAAGQRKAKQTLSADRLSLNREGIPRSDEDLGFRTPPVSNPTAVSPSTSAVSCTPRGSKREGRRNRAMAAEAFISTGGVFFSGPVTSMSVPMSSASN